MTLTSGLCPAPGCGGDPVPSVPWLTTRACPRGTAIIVGGVTVAHASMWEAHELGGELTRRAFADDPWATEGVVAA